MIVLTGPTASGKSELAVRLALRLGAEIVSADSRQVYRGLDAATAKPTAEHRAAVPHHLIDVAEIDETFDAARFARDAAAAVDSIRRRGKIAIIVGGTGLYLRALLQGLSPMPPRDESVRSRLKEVAEREGREALHARLARVDPKAAAAIPAGNLQRVIRALEVFELTGRTLSDHWTAPRAGAVAAAAALRLDVPVKLLDARIAERATKMWSPLLEEARTLIPLRWRGDEPGWSSLGYREAIAVNSGAMGNAQGLEMMIRATRAYAKRQRTWLRGQIDAVGIDGSGRMDDVASRAFAVLEKMNEACLSR